MKKFQVYGALMLLGASVMLTSCFKNEEEDIFDKSASERLDDAKVYYSDILTAEGGKWQMEYYANSDEHGYVYLMTFNKNGQVTISGQNEYIGYELDPLSTGAKVYASQTSLWEVVADNGPVLSFNSYNPVFHIFASPYDIPPYTENGTDESGEGHMGDYEFDLMKYSNDTLYIEGKKREIKMIMTRVDANVDDQIYMNYVTAMADSFFHPKVPMVFMNLPNDKRYAIMNGSTQIVTMWDFDKDRISYETTHNAIVNHDGFALMNPYDAGGYTVQRFVLGDKGTLRCVENPAITVDAGYLNTDVMFNYNTVRKCELDTTKYVHGWTLQPSGLTGDFAAAYQAMITEVNKSTRALNEIYIARLDSIAYNQVALVNPKVPFLSYAMVVKVQMKPGAYTSIILPLVPTCEGEDQVTMVLDDATTTAGRNLLNALASIRDFIAMIDGKKFTITAENLLSPTTLKLAPSGDGSSTMEFTVR